MKTAEQYKSAGFQMGQSVVDMHEDYNCYQPAGLHSISFSSQSCAKLSPKGLKHEPQSAACCPRSVEGDCCMVQTVQIWQVIARSQSTGKRELTQRWYYRHAWGAGEDTVDLQVGLLQGQPERPRPSTGRSPWTSETNDSAFQPGSQPLPGDDCTRSTSTSSIELQHHVSPEHQLLPHHLPSARGPAVIASPNEFPARPELLPEFNSACSYMLTCSDSREGQRFPMCWSELI